MMPMSQMCFVKIARIFIQVLVRNVGNEIISWLRIYVGLLFGYQFDIFLHFATRISGR